MKHNNFQITLGMVAGIKFCLSHYFDSPMNAGWGSDFIQAEFGPASQFDLPNNFFLIILFYWSNDKGFTSDTVAKLDYQERKYEDWYVYFRKISFSFGINF